MKRLFLRPALLACLGLAAQAAFGAEDGARGASAIYLMGGAGGQWLANDDANRYFNYSNSQLGSQILMAYSGHLGFQFARFFALEASAQSGPVRDFDQTYNNGIFNTRHVVAQWRLTTYSITPAITISGLSRSGVGASVGMLGLRLGRASLAGSVHDDAFGVNGSYDSEAQAYDYGVVLRVTQIFVEHLSIGLEAGYDWTKFTEISNKNGGGAYNPPHSPERNISGIGHNGDQSSLDFSGPHLALVIGLWSNPPLRGSAEAGTGASE